MSEQTVINIDPSDLIASALKYKHGGYRLVQMCATKTGEGFELSYSFSLEYEFLTLRMQISEDTEISSISSVFEPAFLYENEMKDLFGVKINNISIDYDGNLYRTSIKTPFNPKEN